MKTEIKGNAIKQMAVTIKIEEAALTAISIYFLTTLDLGLSLWVWVLLFLSPDVSMIAYLAGPRTGAVFYNLFHHRAVAITIAAIGLLFNNDIAIASGILLFSHSSFDRMMGYGLKSTTILSTQALVG